MSGRNRLTTLRRDNLLVDILFQHKGKENAISTKELQRTLSERGYKVQFDCVHSIVKRIVFERHLPICALVHKGYYWGATKQDLQSCIDALQEKMNGLQERIDLLKSFIHE